MPERGEPVGAGALRQVLAPQRVDADAQFVERCARDSALRQPGAEVLPLVEDRDAEARQIAAAHRKRHVARCRG